MNHFLRRGIYLGAWVAGCGMAHAQLATVKTNALLWGNLMPNISMELVTASKFSLEGTVFYGLDKAPLDAQLKDGALVHRLICKRTKVYGGAQGKGAPGRSCRTGTDIRLCLAAEQTVQPGILGRSRCPVV